MKDEEMAEEWVRTKHNILKDCLSACVRVEHKDEIQAFLAGLKVGRPQWHNAKELPPKDKNAPNTSIYVVDQYGQKVFYSFFYKVWKRENGFETKVTHWCEIPTFNKEGR